MEERFEIKCCTHVFDNKKMEVGERTYFSFYVSGITTVSRMFSLAEEKAYEHIKKERGDDFCKGKKILVFITGIYHLTV